MSNATRPLIVSRDRTLQICDIGGNISSAPLATIVKLINGKKRMGFNMVQEMRVQNSFKDLTQNKTESYRIIVSIRKLSFLGNRLDFYSFPTLIEMVSIKANTL